MRKAQKDDYLSRPAIADRLKRPTSLFRDHGLAPGRVYPTAPSRVLRVRSYFTPYLRTRLSPCYVLMQNMAQGARFRPYRVPKLAHGTRRYVSVATSGEARCDSGVSAKILSRGFGCSEVYIELLNICIPGRISRLPSFAACAEKVFGLSSLGNTKM